jgi:predicted translin family RNA/ssDNA-binding protein
MQQETFERIKEQYSQSEKHRQTIIKNGNAALRSAKQAIFALHRNNPDEAKEHLQAAEETFADSEEIIDDFPKLNYQGAHRAALEEYVEAKLFLDYVEGGGFGSVPERAERPDAYLAGLSDFTGELVRLATRRATDGEYEVVDRATEAVSDIVQFLLELDLRGHVRKKADQAKRNLRKLEDMRYEIGLRNESSD